MAYSWPFVPLGEVLAPVSRPEPVKPDQTYNILGAHWYARGLYTKEITAGAGIQANNLYRVQQGDFVYNRLFAWKGSFAVASRENDGCYVSNEFPCFRAHSDRLDATFLWKYFSRSSTWDEALAGSTGGTPTSRNRLKEERLLAFRIPLPPLDEQRRIVAQIEALAAKIEQARGLRVNTTNEGEALLPAAANTLFSPEQLGKWPSFTLGDVSEIRSGVTLGRDLRGPTIRLPYLRVANVKDGHLDLRTIKQVEILDHEKEKWSLRPGDILLTEGGDWDKLGRGTVWGGEIEECIHQNHIFRVRVSPEEFEPDFLRALIGSPRGKAYFQAAAKQTTNLASINQKELKAFTIYRPPLLEQRRIVALQADLQAKVEALKRLQAKTAAELDALLPSILDRAFKGEL